MDRFEAMTILLTAVDTGSFSAASRQLGVPLTTVSRRVRELEEHLKIRLLLRGSRKLVLTDAGSAYVSSCRRIMEEVADIERAAAGEFHAPQGELVFSAPESLGRIHALPLAVEFLQAYPDIRLRVILDNRNVNLLEEHVDVALRVGALPDSSMIGTRVGLIRQVTCASVAYLKSRGKPKKPEDLAFHDCVGYEGLAAGNNWMFGKSVSAQSIPISWRLVVNSLDAAVIAATAGAGIARVLSYQTDQLVKSKSLVTVLEDYEPAAIPVSLIHPSQRQVPLKLRAFLDFAIPRLRERLGS